MKIQKKGWRGYVFSRAINGQMIPQRVQNLVLRAYAEQKELQYLLSATEYHMPDSFMILNSLSAALPGLEGLLFYSINMLPGTTEGRRRLYDALFSAGCGLRFALEELAVSNENDVALIEDLMACRRLSARPPVGILS
ncbi:MAG: LIC12192 family sporadic carbohydrate cluster protein [Elusimicrobiota bacterium]